MSNLVDYLSGLMNAGEQPDIIGKDGIYQSDYTYIRTSVKVKS